MSFPAVRNIKRLQPQDKRSRKIFLSIPNDRIDTRLPLAFGMLLREGQLSRLSQAGSSVDVRLQSAPCGVPTRKGGRQTRNDPVQQFDHARFCRCGRTKRSGVPAPRHGGCIREGDRVRAWVWSFLKLDTSKENWRQGSPLPASKRGQAEHASRCTRIS